MIYTTTFAGFFAQLSSLVYAGSAVLVTDEEALHSYQLIWRALYSHNVRGLSESNFERHKMYGLPMIRKVRYRGAVSYTQLQFDATWQALVDWAWK